MCGGAAAARARVGVRLAPRRPPALARPVRHGRRLARRRRRRGALDPAECRTVPAGHVRLAAARAHARPRAAAPLGVAAALAPPLPRARHSGVAPRHPRPSARAAQAARRLCGGACSPARVEGGRAHRRARLQSQRSAEVAAPGCYRLRGGHVDLATDLASPRSHSARADGERHGPARGPARPTAEPNAHTPLAPRPPLCRLRHRFTGG